MSSLFCRHNRFTADCPICSKNSVLGRETVERAKPATARTRSAATTRKAAAAPAVTRYPHVSVEVDAHEVRLEQVPGGLRLGTWRGGALEKKAPVMPASALRELVDEARGRGYVSFTLPEKPSDSPISVSDSGFVSVSPGRAGDFQEELRLERVEEPGYVRLARWVFYPGTGVGWELQDSPVMLPDKRYEQVLTDAVVKGLL